jgi:hypothetical protein
LYILYRVPYIDTILFSPCIAFEQQNMPYPLVGLPISPLKIFGISSVQLFFTILENSPFPNPFLPTMR